MKTIGCIQTDAERYCRPVLPPMLRVSRITGWVSMLARRVALFSRRPSSSPRLSSGTGKRTCPGTDILDVYATLVPRVSLSSPSSPRAPHPFSTRPSRLLRRARLSLLVAAIRRPSSRNTTRKTSSATSARAAERVSSSSRARYAYHALSSVLFSRTRVRLCPVLLS